MTLEVLTPEKKVFSGEVSSVTVPGTMGSFTVLNNHAPIISTLTEGKIIIKSSAGTDTYQIKSGVIEVLRNKVSLLAEGLSATQ